MTTKQDIPIRSWSTRLRQGTRKAISLLLAIVVSATAFPYTAQAAVTATLEYTGVKTAGGTTFTSSSFTPPNSSLLVVAFAALGSEAPPSMTISGGGLTWTNQFSLTDGSDDRLIIWTAPVTTGSSMTVQLSNVHTTAFDGVMHIVAFEGYDTVTPIGATASDGTFGTNGAQALTLSAAPDSGSMVVGFVAPNSNGVPIDSETTVTPGVGWTEVSDTFSADFQGLEIQTRTGSVSTSVDWVDINDADISMEGQANAAAFEIRAGAGGGGGGSRVMRLLGNVRLIGGIRLLGI